MPAARLSSTVDTKNPGWGQPLLEKIRTVTGNSVMMIINTRSHGDHVSGNGGLYVKHVSGNYRFARK